MWFWVSVWKKSEVYTVLYCNISQRIHGLVYVLYYSILVIWELTATSSQTMISQESTQRAFLPVLEPNQVANAKGVCTAWYDIHELNEYLYIQSWGYGFVPYLISPPSSEVHAALNTISGWSNATLQQFLQQLRLRIYCANTHLLQCFWPVCWGQYLGECIGYLLCWLAISKLQRFLWL